MGTDVTGVMDEELTEELGRIVQRFRGKLVKVTITEVNENESKRGRKA